MGAAPWGSPLLVLGKDAHLFRESSLETSCMEGFLCKPVTLTLQRSRMVGHPSRPHLPARGAGFLVSEVAVCIVGIYWVFAICSRTGLLGPKFHGLKTQPSAQNGGQN